MNMHWRSYSGCISRDMPKAKPMCLHHSNTWVTESLHRVCKVVSEGSQDCTSTNRPNVADVVPGSYNKFIPIQVNLEEDATGQDQQQAIARDN